MAKSAKRASTRKSKAVAERSDKLLSSALKGCGRLELEALVLLPGIGAAWSPAGALDTNAIRPKAVGLLIRAGIIEGRYEAVAALNTSDECLTIRLRIAGNWSDNQMSDAIEEQFPRAWRDVIGKPLPWRFPSGKWLAFRKGVNASVFRVTAKQLGVRTAIETCWNDVGSGIVAAEPVGKPVDLSPLTERQREVYEFIRDNGPVQGHEIANAGLCEESTLTKHIIPELKRSPYNVRNKARVGYYVDGDLS